MHSPDSKLSIALGKSGAYSMMDYARKHPLASLAELASALDGVEPSEVERRFIEEAQDMDELRLHARELLYRYVLNLGAGWPAGGAKDELAAQLASWQRCVRGAPFDAMLAAVTASLLAATHIPAGWKPDGAKHEWLAEPFDQSWKL
jgi:hypothetical protein